ncbi:MAG: viologen exporter family transport system permease protein [Actinomycetota bacterium]|jgi:ABC-2 type transport system permease protein|nr:viologen exporter family transport system permease protein [Actinomycetota bacterium]
MRPYLAALTSGMKRTIGGPGELLVRTGFYCVILVVFAALWRAAIQTNGGPLEGYDYAALLWYVAGAEAAVIATKPRLIEDIGYDIGNGTIAVEMLRPVSVAAFRMSVEIGEAYVRLTAAMFVGSIVVWLFAGPPPSAEGVLVAIPMLLLAVAINVAAQHAFAAAAFWLDDAKSTWFLYQKLIFLLGGMLLPLELLPHTMETVSRALPFWTMAYVPARSLSGHPEPGLLLVQVMWLGVLALAALGAFRMGERRLQVVGG